MKIGLFFGTFTGGGAERMMINLAKGLSDNGQQVTIYVVNKTGAYIDIIPHNIKVVSLHAQYGVKSVIPKIRQLLKANILDAFISTQEHINTAVAIASIGLKKKNRPALIFRESSTPSQRGHGLFLRFIYYFMYKSADKFVTVSEAARKDSIRYYGFSADDVVTIYNPVVDTAIVNLMDEDVDDLWFNNTEEHPVIVSMGRIIPLKRFEDVVEALYRLRKKIPARLIIFGQVRPDTKYWAMLTSKISRLGLADAVKFPGFAKNPFKYFKNASLFVSSSEFEGLPGALIQAMACGCPVVSTDCPSGPREILRDGKYGPLVEVGNQQALTDAMEQTLLNPINGNILKKRAQFFSVENATQNYFKLIKKIGRNA